MIRLSATARRACIIAQLFAVLLWGLSSSADSSSSNSSTHVTGLWQDLRLSKDFFRRYLENPYPIRSIAFAMPADPRTNSAGLHLYEGGLQENTFYLHSKADKGSFPTGGTSGQATDGSYWFLNKKAAQGVGGEVDITLPNHFDPVANTEGKFRALESLRLLRGACSFGLTAMVPHSIIWHQDQFTVLWYGAGWPHDTNCYTVNGEVLAYTNNMPVVIRLQSTNWPKNYKWIDFNYDYDFSNDNRFYPKNIWADLTLVHDMHVQGVTFQVLSIEYGEADHPDIGYQATDFLPSKSKIAAQTFVSSNGVTYWANSNSWEKIEPPTDRFALQSSLFVSRATRLIIIMLFIFPAVIWGVAVKRRLQKNKFYKRTEQ